MKIIGPRFATAIGATTFRSCGEVFGFASGGDDPGSLLWGQCFDGDDQPGGVWEGVSLG